jgi:hypothetical protein
VTLPSLYTLYRNETKKIRRLYYLNELACLKKVIPRSHFYTFLIFGGNNAIWSNGLDARLVVRGAGPQSSSLMIVLLRSFNFLFFSRPATTLLYILLGPSRRRRRRNNLTHTACRKKKRSGSSVRGVFIRGHYRILDKPAYPD